MTNLNKIDTQLRDIKFKDELIKKMVEKDKVLIGFIDDKLKLKKTDFNLEEVNRNINSLKTLNGNQKHIVRAKAKQLEEQFDTSKYFPTIVGACGLILILYRTIISDLSNIYGFSINIVVTAMVVFFLLFSILYDLKKRSTAVYFNNLIKNVLKDK